MIHYTSRCNRITYVEYYLNIMKKNLDKNLVLFYYVIKIELILCLMALTNYVLCMYILFILN